MRRWFIAALAAIGATVLVWFLCRPLTGIPITPGELTIIFLILLFEIARTQKP